MIGPGVMMARTGSSIAVEFANHCPTWPTAERLASEPGTRIAWSSSVHAAGLRSEVRRRGPPRRPSGSASGQREPERAPVARAALEVEVAAVGLDEPSAQGQPDPAAAEVLRALLVGLEDALLVDELDPRAVVAHRDAHPLVVGGHRHVDRAHRFGEYFTALPSRFQAIWRIRRASASASTALVRSGDLDGDAGLAGPAPHEQVGIGHGLGDVDAGQRELEGARSRPWSRRAARPRAGAGRARSRRCPPRSSAGARRAARPTRRAARRRTRPRR